MMPNLSVLMPVYNASRYLGVAIESILSQTYTDFELIIIHDGSTDHSLEIIHQLTDPRIKLIDNPVNSGIVSCVNSGFAASSGAFIARMDADDYSLPNRFKAQLQFMNVHSDIGVCGTQYRIIGKVTPEVPVSMLPTQPDILACSLLLQCCLAHPTVMMRRNILERLEGPLYEISYKHAEDYRLWARLSGITRMANLKEIHLLYRHHEGQITRTMSREQLMQADRIRLELLNQLGLYPTPEEWETHLDLCNWKCNGDPSSREWIRKILSNNLLIRKYDQAALMQVLNQWI
ncbi:glycosyltransferase family 2 protein [Paenibacillus wynnii]|uniref:glycosyltransferase family 2 protein n=1 Tax=Paenibacillus wynnii TaxID=268407 RepID=UPI00278D87A1|nr:glycosyltransferase family 2 protein [Paenibacillus wynnii]MDQ0194557.1 glycosyltransferase involved in cell wall biosynthesis [Paenibacillus wynnii]